MAVFAVMYGVFSAVACYYAYSLCPKEGDGTLSLEAVQLSACLMVLVAVLLALYTVLWLIASAKKSFEKYNTKFFGFLCVLAAIMFFIPSSVTSATANLLSGNVPFMAFTPVLSAPVLMISASVLMFGIIKSKNGGSIRKRKIEKQ